MTFNCIMSLSVCVIVKSLKKTKSKHVAHLDTYIIIFSYKEVVLRLILDLLIYIVSKC